MILDVGCGVASFGGYLFDKDVLAMSFAPKDEHEAQVQFALERGIPAISAVMGTKRLPFPSAVFDAIHCARCRVPWHIEGYFSLFFLSLIPFLNIGCLCYDTCATKIIQGHFYNSPCSELLFSIYHLFCAWDACLIKYVQKRQ